MAVIHSTDLDRVSMGGISQYVEEIIKSDREYEITVFGACEPGRYELGKRYQRTAGGRGYDFIPIVTNERLPLSVYYLLRLFGWMKRLRQYDIIYCQRMEYVLPFLFSRMKRKVVMAVHGSGRYFRLYKGRAVGAVYEWAEGLAVRAAAAVVVLLNREEFGAPHYRAKFRSRGSRIFFGRVPVDLNLFYRKDRRECRKKWGIGERDTVLLYCGRLDENPKRILLLPELVEKLEEEPGNGNVTCMVIGDGNDRGRLEEKAAAMGLRDRFLFAGKLEHGEQMTEAVCCCDFSLILSSFEGICMSALESLACGVPVVATDVGDIGEYVRGGLNGCVLPDGAPEEIVENAAAAIRELRKHPPGMNRVYENYSSEKMIEELHGIFEKAGQ